MTRNLTPTEITNKLGDNIYVDLDELRIQRYKPDDCHKAISIYIDEHINSDLLCVKMARLEHLIAIYWMLSKLRHYDSSPASQRRKVIDMESCQYEIETHAERFNLPEYI